MRLVNWKQQLIWTLQENITSSDPAKIVTFGSKKQFVKKSWWGKSTICGWRSVPLWSQHQAVFHFMRRSLASDPVSVSFVDSRNVNTRLFHESPSLDEPYWKWLWLQVAWWTKLLTVFPQIQNDFCDRFLLWMHRWRQTLASEKWLLVWKWEIFL